MASITISLASGTTGKLYATASSLLYTSATQPSSSITITCSAEGTTGADITLREATDGSHITNCPMLAIRWKPNGYTQEVLFGSSTANKPMAQFKYGSTTISYSTTTVPANGTITVTALAGSGTADTTAPSDVGIGGYYYAHNGLGGRYNYSNGTYTYEEYTSADSQQGIRSKPARCGNRVPVDISFKYNGTAKYFVFMMMRGWAGASAGCPGDMGMLAGTGPIVNSTFQTGWADGYDTYRIDVFALSPSGIYPSPANMPGDGSSQTSCPSNSTWVKWPEDSSLSTYNVTYYGTDGSTILRSNTEAKLPLQFTKVSNSAITFYKGTELYKYLSGDSGTLVIPSGKRFKGWQKKVGSGSYGSVITTASGMGKVGSSNVSLKLVVEEDTVDISFKSNYPSGSSGSTADRTQSWVIGSSQSLLSAPSTPTKTGYTYAFAGWYTTASGGTKVGDAGTSYTVPSSNTTLYAHWTETAVKYTITYNSNGGSSVSPQDYYITTNLTLASAPSKVGYTFSGWKSTTTTGGWSATTYSASQNVGTGHSGNITLVAQWTANTYTLEFVINTEHYPTSSDGDAGNVPTKPANRTVTYGGTWAGNGFNSLPGLSTVSGDPDNWDEYFDAWKWDYEFVGWFDAETGGTEKTATTTYDVADNSTLYAKWEKTQKKYTVIWKNGITTDADPDGDGAVIKTDTDVLAGTLIQSLAPEDPQRDGYTFSGWKNMPSYEEVRDNFTFVAQYEIVTKDVILKQKSGNGSWVEISRQSFTVNDIPKQITTEATKQNFEFLGWSLSDVGSDFSFPYTIQQWTGDDIILYAKFRANIVEIVPKPGYPGYDEDDPDNDNDNYGIPIDALDDGYKYRLRLRVVGDRTGTPIYNISVGEITEQQNGIWEWNYSSDVLTVAELSSLMTETLFVMDVWRCIVEHTTGVLEVTLETYDDGGYLDGDKKNNEFQAYDYMVPYVDAAVVNDDSDVVPVEGVPSIENLDLWANGLDKLFTKRFIGNGKSTVSVYITAHSKKNGQEVLYGAVPVNYFCLLDSIEATETYPTNIPVYFEFSDEDDVEYRSPRLDITTNPFPNIVHKNANDWISASLKIKVYDSRRMARPEQEP